MTRLRRAVLVVPATSWPKLEKAAGLDVDEVVIDLEDAVPRSMKTDETRRQAVDAISRLTWRAPTVGVRVNAVGTRWFEDDIAAVVERRPAPRELHRAAEGRIGRGGDGGRRRDRSGVGRGTIRGRGRIGCRGAHRKRARRRPRREIAAATPRLEALIFGAGDYAASMGLPMAAIGAIDPAYPGDQWAYPRARIAVAARAFGLDAIDGPYAAFHDLDGLAESADERARSVFRASGRSIPARSRRASPCSARQADELARGRTNACRPRCRGPRTGEGATVSDGSMVDEASRRQAERTVENARRPAP